LIPVFDGFADVKLSVRDSDRASCIKSTRFSIHPITVTKSAEPTALY